MRGTLTMRGALDIRRGKSLVMLDFFIDREKVRAHACLGEFRVTAAKRGEQLGMFIHRTRQATRNLARQQSDAMELIAQSIKHHTEPLVVGLLMQNAMKLMTDLGRQSEFPTVIGVMLLAQQILEMLDLLINESCAGAERRQPFEHGTQFENFVRVVLCQFRDKIASVRHDHDEAGLFKTAQRLANRRLRNAERSGQLRFDKRLSWTQRHLQDGLADALISAIRQRFIRQRLKN